MAWRDATVARRRVDNMLYLPRRDVTGKMTGIQACRERKAGYGKDKDTSHRHPDFSVLINRVGLYAG